MADYCEISVDLKIRDFAQVTREAVDTLAKNLERRSQENLRSGGLGRFTRTTRVKVAHIGGGSWQVDLLARPGWVRVYEYGGTTLGKPLLWMPVNQMLPVRASRYPGKLFRPPGKRVLLAPRIRTGPRMINRGGAMVPARRQPYRSPESLERVKYIGVPSITYTPRLGLRGIAEQEANEFVALLEEK